MDWQTEYYPKVFALLRNRQHYLGKTVNGSSELPSLTTTCRCQAVEHVLSDKAVFANITDDFFPPKINK